MWIDYEMIMNCLMNIRK
ncbi:hypothetical protein Gotri_007086 [Gossypium trilobum]|uniref:Uncharacterized protein n=1 Tax=Gossypium trilobum TaxID=34281 RepID=A0A7J9EEX0_9ROSI|nr:hypothetical protein [Gossypium trilobum]